MLNIRHIDFTESEQDKKRFSSIVDEFRNSGILTNVHLRVASKYEHVPFSIRIRPAITWRSPSVGGRFITIYTPADTELMPKFDKLFSKYDYTFEGTGCSTEIVYLGPLLKEAGLHVYFKRGDVMRYRNSDNFQPLFSNLFILGRQDIKEAETFIAKLNTYHGYGNSFGNFSTYEISEIHKAQSLYQKLKLKEEEMSEVEFLKWFHKKLVDFEEAKLLQLLNS